MSSTNCGWRYRFSIAIPLIMLFCVKTAFGAEDGIASVPKMEQIVRLVESAWKPPLTSIDAPLVVSVTRPAIAREELEKNVRKAYAVVERNSNNTKVSAEELEESITAEVERLIKEQLSPAIIKKRIRWNGIQYREDKVSAEGENVIDSKMEFNRVIVNAGNPLLKDYY